MLAESSLSSSDLLLFFGAPRHRCGREAVGVSAGEGRRLEKGFAPRRTIAPAIDAREASAAGLVPLPLVREEADRA